MDNRLPPTGYTPTPKKACLRCGQPVDCPELYNLCDACHEADRTPQILTADGGWIDLPAETEAAIMDFFAANSDHRTAAQADLDQWQAETQATQEAARP